MKRLRANITYANVVATLAVLFAMSGTAFAAVVITGANVKDGSLLDRDFAYSSLVPQDLNQKARQKLIGPVGDRGLPGFTGLKGPTGERGPTGPIGESARLTSAWATRSTGAVTDNTASRTSPNIDNHDWDDPAYGTSWGSPFANLRPQGSYVEAHLSSTNAMMLALWGSGAAGTNETKSSFPLTLPWAGRVTATATLTFLHRNDGEDLATNTGGTMRHARLQCGLAYGQTNDFATFTPFGVTQYASSNVQRQLVNVVVTGDIDTSAVELPAGIYNVAVMCRDADYTGNPQWTLANGNMTVVASDS